jgi:bacteriophage N4 adsorption protein B
MAETSLWFLNRSFQELLLLCAVGFAIIGLDEFAIDCIWIIRRAYRGLTVYRTHPRTTTATLAPPTKPVKFAVFVPAWDESAVIEPMLRHAIAAYELGNVHIFVGCYPNDEATLAQVLPFVSRRVSRIINIRAGPTTKADCLNALWAAMLEAEATSGEAFHAVILHDAEDVISRDEIRIFESLAGKFGLIQLPVIPLIDLGSRWISGHYCDEFAESHCKSQTVREALGAALPAAGVGCAFSTDILRAMAVERGTGPFDESSLTEDYELGLRLHALKARSAFVRILDSDGLTPVATRAHFPATIDAAVKQKSRWIVGIALAGWDRLGWGDGIFENWMRLRDRIAPFSALILAMAYFDMLLGIVIFVLASVTGHPLLAFSPTLDFLMGMTAILLVWRMLARCFFVTRLYGFLEGIRSIPRMVVGNVIAILAARRAIFLYARMLRNRTTIWEKTAHKFPNSAQSKH